MTQIRETRTITGRARTREKGTEVVGGGVISLVQLVAPEAASRADPSSGRHHVPGRHGQRPPVPLPSLRRGDDQPSPNAPSAPHPARTGRQRHRLVHQLSAVQPRRWCHPRQSTPSATTAAAAGTANASQLPPRARRTGSSDTPASVTELVTSGPVTLSATNGSRPRPRAFFAGARGDSRSFDEPDGAA